MSQVSLNRTKIIFVLLSMGNIGLNVYLFLTTTLPVIRDSGGPHGYIKLFLFPLFFIHLMTIPAIAGIRNRSTKSWLALVNIISIILVILVIGFML